MTEDSTPGTGGCACGHVRYRLTAAPMVTHCCHCSRCQRETGSAFAVNALIETSAVEILAGVPDLILTPSASGKGQKIARCPDCHVAVWSHYPNADTLVAFIRAGTLDDKTTIRPDVHIYTSTKAPWLEITDGKPVFEEYYPSPAGVWPEDGLARWRAVIASRGA
ncbi:MAG: GFA family protein [Hyphomonas sp.]|nr:GFA family protein [Hyphomonas sp.]